MLIDTHCHLSIDDYDNLDEIITNMPGIMITAGTNDKTNLEVIELVNKYSNVYGVIGIHPEEINNITSNSFKIIEDNINNPKIVGIGEIGLDYYWVKDNIIKQQELFIKQLNIAKKYRKPVVIHSRESINDTYNILSNYQGLKKVMHCYSGSLEMAKKFIDIGCLLGVGGTLTFKNNKKTKDVVSNIDINNLVLETDSPYLTPEPFRGQKNNPMHVFEVALKLSEIKKLSVEKTLEITGKNIISQFDLNIKL